MSWDRYWQKWIRRLCRAKISEKEAHKRFVASKVSTCSPDPVYRHNDCWGPPCRSLYARLNLALLSCCRQIYLEAHPIFISANTWSITMSWVFKMFYLESQIPPLLCEGLKLKTDLIRSLHISITISTESDETCWNESFELIAQHLISLQHLYLDIDQRPDPGPLLKKWRFEKPAESPFLEGLRRLGDPKLRTVTVNVSDSGIFYWLPQIWMGEDVNQFRWTLMQKQEWAGYITRVLLGQEE